LEEANSGEPGGARSKTCAGVFEGDSTDREHRDCYCAADFGKALDALRRAEGNFQWCGEHGAKEEIAGAAARGGFCSFERMAGNAH